MAKKAGEIVVSEETVDSNIIPYFFSIDKIEKPNCKLCQSEFREEAEEIYESQTRKNYTEIKNKLKERHDFDISMPAVQNHIIYHYKITQNNVSLQEYAENIQGWVNMQTNKVAALRARIAVMEREMFSIAQQSEDIDLTERRKNAETIKKLAETILTYENKLSDFHEQAKPVNLIFNQLKIIVNDEMQHIESIKTKKVLSKVLTRLKDSVGDMVIEG